MKFKKDYEDRPKTSFRGYFRKQDLNRFLKNLFVLIPNLSISSQKVKGKLNNLYSPVIKTIFRKDRNIKRGKSTLNLKKLSEELTIRLKAIRGGVFRIFRDKKYKYEKIDLDYILQNQGSTLRRMIEEQKKVLKEETIKIMEEEKERLRKKYNKRTSKRKKHEQNY